MKPETMDFGTFFDDIDSSGRLAGRFTLIRIEPTGTALHKQIETKSIFGGVAQLVRAAES
jgi:hypothetical protein